MDSRVTKPWNTESICNIAGALAWQAARQPATVAIHYPRKLSGRTTRFHACNYRELNELSNAYAHGLAAQGITAGTRTALMLHPGLDFVAVFFALFKAGAVPVLIDPGIGLPSLKQCLDEAAPEVFIGVTRAQLARRWFGWAKASCKTFITAGPSLGLGGITLQRLQAAGTAAAGEDVLHPARPDDMAAILFTSGSTGLPKGVVYRHKQFAAQVELLQRAYGIEPGEVGLSTFPPFALFDPALGITTVVPPMDPTRPARANPEKLVKVIDQFAVTNVFASPAVVDLISRHTEQRGNRMWSIKRVISAGAAVPPKVVRRLQQALAQDALIHTPYGATECLPVTTINHRQLDAKVESMTESGEGICVGWPIEPNQVRVIGMSENAFSDLSETTPMPPGMPGEIIVSGPSCSDRYWQRDGDTELAKIADEKGNIWHRMGDIGVLDGRGCLWFCGRKAQRIETGQETLFAEQVEGIFNQHPDALRTALVGVGTPGRQIPVLCVEPVTKLAPVDRERVHYDLLQLAQAHALTRSVRSVLFHPGFPVDIRHNSKINRDKLAQWAAGKIA